MKFQYFTQWVEKNIDLKEGATLKLWKARFAPYAIKDKVNNETGRLLETGILESVGFLEWATPIVPVMKPNGSAKLCGDYNSTIKTEAKLGNYTIPNTEDLLASLHSGLKFVKLDLKQAYLQLLSHEKSQEYLMLNTPKGLFCP